MSKRKIKRKIRKSFHCGCDDPNCGENKMASVCAWVGHDLPRVRPSQVPELFGFAGTPESIDHFLTVRCKSHSPEKVVAGEEALGHLPFVLEFEVTPGQWGFLLLSLSPIPSSAGRLIQ